MTSKKGYHALMVEYTYIIMDMMDKFLFIKVNYKEQLF